VAFWTDAENKFILENPTLTPTELYRAWLQTFGETRTFPSVEHKVYKLRGPFSSRVVTEDLVSSPTATPPPTDAGFEWLQSTLAAAKAITPKPPQEEPGKRTRVLFLSDLHFGQQHEMFDYPFNMQAARDRLLAIPYKMKGPKPGKIVVAFGGDCIEGENIYPNQQVHIEKPAIEQAQAFSVAIWEMLELLYKKFSCPIDVYTVPGNHGTTGKYASELSNWDNVGYLLLQALSGLSEAPISVHYNPQEFCMFTVRGHKILLNHHGVKHTGTPAMRTKLAGWRELFEYDIFLHGHWHEWKVVQWFGKFVLCNGSLGGVNKYATKLAVGGPPMQTYFDLIESVEPNDFRIVNW